MEQKTITYEEFFTPDFLSLLFYLIVFLIVIKFMELWSNGISRACSLNNDLLILVWQNQKLKV